MFRNIIPQKIRPFLYLQALAIRKSQGQVYSGPFKGMKYIAEASGSALTPKMIGVYEKELHEWFQYVLGQSYSKIVDIGSAEGYYAIGLALAFPQTRVTAFDLNPKARMLLKELACLNAVLDQVQICERCDHDSLNRTVEPNSLIVCDVEGAESELLNADKIPNLGSATMVVEVHDELSSDCGEILKQRFCVSHNLRKIEAVPRRPDDYPFSNIWSRLFPASSKADALIERPATFPPQYWLTFVPKSQI